jgi:hypothetical protein
MQGLAIMLAEQKLEPIMSDEPAITIPIAIATLVAVGFLPWITIVQLKAGHPWILWQVGLWLLATILVAVLSAKMDNPDIMLFFAFVLLVGLIIWDFHADHLYNAWRCAQPHAGCIS